MSRCESCDKPTRSKEFMGITYCGKCSTKYKKSTHEAVQILVRNHKKEYDKILDKRIDINFEE